MKRGFTIIEVLVVLVILITLLAIGYLSLTGIQRRASITATVNTFIADVRAAQTKAMSGNAKNVAISFQSDGYTILPANSVIPVPTYISLSPAGALMTFENGSGDVSGNTAITITQTLTGEHKTITFDQYGAVTSIQ